MSQNDRDECDPILVADDDGEVLADGNGDGETCVCEHCGEAFDPDDVPTVPIPSTVLYRCPACERWTE